MRCFRTVLWLVIVFLPSASLGEEFTITAGEDGNEVVFESKAAMETVRGTTDQVSGSLEADLANLAGEVLVQVSVDLASIDTGIGMRNTHMRENHLHTDEHPTAVFLGDRIVSAPQPALARGQEVEIVIAGSLSLHGVTQPLEVPVSLQLDPDGSLVVETSFVVLLADFEIPRPKFLVLKLAEEQKIQVKLLARPAAGGREEATD